MPFEFLFFLFPLKLTCQSLLSIHKQPLLNYKTNPFRVSLAYLLTFYWIHILFLSLFAHIISLTLFSKIVLYYFCVLRLTRSVDFGDFWSANLSIVQWIRHQLTFQRSMIWFLTFDGSLNSLNYIKNILDSIKLFVFILRFHDHLRIIDHAIFTRTL